VSDLYGSQRGGWTVRVRHARIGVGAPRAYWGRMSFWAPGPRLPNEGLFRGLALHSLHAADRPLNTLLQVFKVHARTHRDLRLPLLI
jgi:hypothetical protein